MSFSGMVKEELTGQVPSARHCRIAELAAIFSLCGRLEADGPEKPVLKLQMENEALSRKCFTLLKKTFKIGREDFNLEQGAGYHYSGPVFSLNKTEKTGMLVSIMKLRRTGAQGDSLDVSGEEVLQKTCCRKAFIRGAFLACGSMSDPEKGYHFEIAASHLSKAALIQETMEAFHVSARIVPRKKSQVVYVKEGAQIADLLAAMGASVALMEFENVRILKEMRNTVNRKVNCETANINKTVNAAVKQAEDIELIRQTIGFENLGKGLKEIAVLRTTYPEATLAELGELSDPRLGKSGVNHRLRKLGMIADDIKERTGLSEAE